MAELLCKEEVYAVVGAMMEVYNQLGPGFLEAVYQEALEIEFTERGIPFCSQPELPIYYKGRRLKKFYVADFLVYDQVILEIKSQDYLRPTDEAQLLNELKATHLQVGVLSNFGAKDKLDWHRKVFTRQPIPP